MNGYATAYQNIGWTVGNFCNAHCRHCYSWKVRRDSQGALSRSEVDRILEQLLRLGAKTVNLGGNEPIYTHGADPRRSILPYVIARLSDCGIPVGFTTNGATFRYLYERHRGELSKVNDIDFSLDSPFAAEHDRGRGLPLFRDVVGDVQRARELGIDASIVVCGMKHNFSREVLSAFLALAKILACELRINLLKPVEPELLGQMPTREQFYQGMAFLLANTTCVTLAESCVGALVHSGRNGCPCGTSSFRINGKTRDGRVPLSPCVYLHDFRAGDLLTEDIFDILSSRQFEVFRRRGAELPAACRTAGCPLLERCRGGCAARAYFVGGDMDRPDPYCPCEIVWPGGQLPSILPEAEFVRGQATRVHDNYLCTWIGRVKESFVDSRYRGLDDFLAGTCWRPSAVGS